MPAGMQMEVSRKPAGSMIQGTGGRRQNKTRLGYLQLLLAARNILPFAKEVHFHRIFETRQAEWGGGDGRGFIHGTEDDREGGQCRVWCGVVRRRVSSRWMDRQERLLDWGNNT